MKKIISLSALVLILGIAFTSCKKREHEHKTNYQTIEIVLDMNKSYQYNFGTPESELAITKQANEFLVSELDEMSGTVLFNYMPKTNFVGTDEVQVTLGKEEEHHEHHGSHHLKNPIKHLLGGGQHHDCDNHSEDKTVYTFKFTVNSIATTSTPVHINATEKH